MIYLREKEENADSINETIVEVRAAHAGFGFMYLPTALSNDDFGRILEKI